MTRRSLVLALGGVLAGCIDTGGGPPPPPEPSYVGAVTADLGFSTPGQIEIDACATTNSIISLCGDHGVFYADDGSGEVPLPNDSIFVQTTPVAGGPGSAIAIRWDLGDGSVRSTITMPADFTIDGPVAGADAPAGAVVVTWSPSGSGDPMAANLIWSCGDGSSTTVLYPQDYPDLANDTGRLVLDTVALGFPGAAGVPCSAQIDLERDHATAPVSDHDAELRVTGSIWKNGPDFTITR